MLIFTSVSDLDRLPKTNPAHPVIAKLASGLFSEPDNPVTLSLMQPHDTDQPLADLCSSEDVTLEGIIERESMFMIALQTSYQYSIVFIVPDADWLNGEFRQCIEENLYH